MLLTVNGREREPGLWGFTDSRLGWTSTNTGGSSFTWSEQVFLWAARMYCSSSLSAFRAATSSSRLRFFFSQLLTSTCRVSIWSSLFCLHRAAASLFLFLLMDLFSSSSGSSSSSSAFLLLARGLAVFSVLTLYFTTLGTHSSSARMTSPLLAPSWLTTVVEPPPQRL